MTGEVVTGTAERLVTGDAVNVAARLEQAAAAGHVLIGQPTLALVRDAVEVEPASRSRSKARPSLLPPTGSCASTKHPERSHDTPFVGRDRELALVRDAWERVAGRAQSASSSRSSATRASASPASSPRLWPRSTRRRARPLPAVRRGDHVLARRRGAQAARRPAADEAAASAIRSLLGESEAPTSAEEIAWAVPQDPRARGREAAAGRRVRRHPVGRADVPRPHRARRTPLDGRGHPAALHGPARALRAQPRLAGQRPPPPLDDDDVDALIPIEIAGDLRVRIARAAGGNPLFVGEMLAMADETQGDVIVPPTLQRTARSAPRPARPVRATRARVRLHRRRDLPPRRHPGTRTRRDSRSPRASPPSSASS